MVMYFKANCMQGRSNGTARAMGSNAMHTSMSIRRDVPAREYWGKGISKNNKIAKHKPKPHQHPLGKNFKKRGLP